MWAQYNSFTEREREREREATRTWHLPVLPTSRPHNNTVLFSISRRQAGSHPEESPGRGKHKQAAQPHIPPAPSALSGLQLGTEKMAGTGWIPATRMGHAPSHVLGPYPTKAHNDTHVQATHTPRSSLSYQQMWGAYLPMLVNSHTTVSYDIKLTLLQWVKPGWTARWSQHTAGYLATHTGWGKTAPAEQGVVLLPGKSDLQTQEVTPDLPHLMEALFFRIVLQDNSGLLLCILYRPPRQGLPGGGAGQLAPTLRM